VAAIRFANLMIILAGSYLSMRLQELTRHPLSHMKWSGLEEGSGMVVNHRVMSTQSVWPIFDSKRSESGDCAR
jgi:hypothetical protein